MRRQTRIVVGLLDQVLRSRPLIVEPHQPIHRFGHMGDKYAIAVFRRVEQLVLLRLVLPELGFLLLAEGDASIGLVPALWLVVEFTLPLGIGTGRRLPVRRFQFLHPTGGLAR